MVYIVSFESGVPGRDGAAVRAALEACGTVNAFQRTVWLVDSSLTAPQIRNELKPSLDVEDSVFVSALDLRSWAGWKTRLKVWLSEHGLQDP